MQGMDTYIPEGYTLTPELKSERTTEFAKAHPEADKYTDADKEELEELERSQREVAGLFDKIKDLFKKKMMEEQP